MTGITWRDQDVIRFWKRVLKSDGCWTYTGARLRKKNGDYTYGSFGVRKRRVLAHRFAYAITYGSPDPALKVCHQCDNPICVRPDHLFIGTQRDNLRDMRQKGRGYINAYPPGEKHPKAKIGIADVHVIRRDFAAGVSVYRLAARYGIHYSTIHDVATGKTWKSVPWEIERPAPRSRVVRSGLASGKDSM